jgi:hypothetical protein
MDVVVGHYVRLSAESVMENALDCMLHDNEMALARAIIRELNFTRKRMI